MESQDQEYAENESDEWREDERRHRADTIPWIY